MLQRRRINGARDEATGGTLADEVKTIDIALDLQRIVRAIEGTRKRQGEELLRWRIPPACPLMKAQVAVFFVRLCDHSHSLFAWPAIAVPSV